MIDRLIARLRVLHCRLIGHGPEVDLGSMLYDPDPPGSLAGTLAGRLELVGCDRCRCARWEVREPVLSSEPPWRGR